MSKFSLQRVSIGIRGMTSSSCSTQIETTLRHKLGVLAAKVDFSTSSVEINYDPSSATPHNLLEEIRSIGFQADILITGHTATSSPMHGSSSSFNNNNNNNSPSHIIRRRTAVLGIDGMTCSACTGTVESAINTVSGVDTASVEVTLATNTASLVYDASTTNLDVIIEEIESVGFDAEVLQDNELDGGDAGGSNSANSSSGGGGSGGYGRNDPLLPPAGLDLNNGSAAPPSPAALGRGDSQDSGNGGIRSLLLEILAHVPPASKKQSGQGDHGGGGEGDDYPEDVNVLEEGEGEFNSGGGVSELDRTTMVELMQEIHLLDGVLQVDMREKDAHIKVTFDDAISGPRDFVRVISSRGFRCRITTMGGFMMANRLLRQQKREAGRLYYRLILGVVLTLPILLITMVLPLVPQAKRVLVWEVSPGLTLSGLLLFFLSLPVQFYVGRQFHIKAWKSIKIRRLGMDFLVSTGTMAAYIYSTVALLKGVVDRHPHTRDVEYFETSAVLITAVLLGKYLEVYARGQTAQAIHKLSTLKAHKARLVKSGTEYDPANPFKPVPGNSASGTDGSSGRATSPRTAAYLQRFELRPMSPEGYMDKMGGDSLVPVPIMSSDSVNARSSGTGATSASATIAAAGDSKANLYSHLATMGVEEDEEGGEDEYSNMYLEDDDGNDGNGDTFEAQVMNDKEKTMSFEMKPIGNTKTSKDHASYTALSGMLPMDNNNVVDDVGTKPQNSYLSLSSNSNRGANTSNASAVTMSTTTSSHKSSDSSGSITTASGGVGGGGKQQHHANTAVGQHWETRGDDDSDDDSIVEGPDTPLPAGSAGGGEVSTGSSLGKLTGVSSGSSELQYTFSGLSGGDGDTLGGSDPSIINRSTSNNQSYAPFGGGHITTTTTNSDQQQPQLQQGPSAVVIVGGDAGEQPGEKIISASLLHRRDIVRLVTGETVPADGILLEGYGAHIGVDEAMMTGESLVVGKKERDNVFAGTMVVEGSALMQVTACGDDSTLGRIIHTVQQAQASKPPIQELADRVARIFVPVIATISLSTFALWVGFYQAGMIPPSWYSTQGSPYLFAFFFALAVWVSACPCAFGLATPTAVLVSTGVAAKHGVLIRKGAALQHAADITAVAFDKTGTLTQGSTEISDFLYCEEKGDSFVPLGDVGSGAGLQDMDYAVGVDEDDVSLWEARYLLQLMLQAECRSSHPLARGITNYCVENILALNDHIASTSQSSATHPQVLQELCRRFDLPKEAELAFDVVPGAGVRMFTVGPTTGYLNQQQQQQRHNATNSSSNGSKSNDANARSTGNSADFRIESDPDDVETGFTIEDYEEAELQERGPIEVLVGSGKLLESFHVVIPREAMNTAMSYRAGGKSAVFMALNGELRAIIGVSDAVRPEAAFVVRSLQSKGIPCYMITGDEETTALAIAKAVGIPPDNILARAKPDDKKGFISALQRQQQQQQPGVSLEGGGGGARVAFVGDGTNDSPALAQANVGFTMATGSDIAVEAGDMVLCKNDLQALLIALDLSAHTMQRIHLNYFWALVYNACLIPIAAGALYPTYHFALAPMLAGAAMALSSVSIVLSSMLLMRYEPPKMMATESQSSSSSSSSQAAVVATTGENSHQCNCPASSTVEEEEPPQEMGLMGAIWYYLLGFDDLGASSTHKRMKEPLLSPAEWKKDQMDNASLHGKYKKVPNRDETNGGDDYEGENYGEGGGGLVQPILQLNNAQKHRAVHYKQMAYDTITNRKGSFQMRNPIFSIAEAEDEDTEKWSIASHASSLSDQGQRMRLESAGSPFDLDVDGQVEDEGDSESDEDEEEEKEEKEEKEENGVVGKGVELCPAGSSNKSWRRGGGGGGGSRKNSSTSSNDSLTAAGANSEKRPQRRGTAYAHNVTTTAAAQDFKFGSAEMMQASTAAAAATTTAATVVPGGGGSQSGKHNARSTTGLSSFTTKEGSNHKISGNPGNQNNSNGAVNDVGSSAGAGAGGDGCGCGKGNCKCGPNCQCGTTTKKVSRRS